MFISCFYCLMVTEYFSFYTWSSKVRLSWVCREREVSRLECPENVWNVFLWSMDIAKTSQSVICVYPWHPFYACYLETNSVMLDRILNEGKTGHPEQWLHHTAVTDLWCEHGIKKRQDYQLDVQSSRTRITGWIPQPEWCWYVHYGYRTVCWMFVFTWEMFFDKGTQSEITIFTSHLVNSWLWRSASLIQCAGPKYNDSWLELFVVDEVRSGNAVMRVIFCMWVSVIVSHIYCSQLPDSKRSKIYKLCVWENNAEDRCFKTYSVCLYFHLYADIMSGNPF